MDIALVLVVVLLSSALSGGVAARLVWRLYAVVRAERDQLKRDNDVIQKDRDGWREVAQRALVVAQIGRTVTRRAARLTAKVSK